MSWKPHCENWYKISFKFICRVRALGAFIRNTYLAGQQRPKTKNLSDDMSATSCKKGTSWVFPSTPLIRSTAVSLTVGREVTVALSTGSLWKCDHIRKDASWAGDSPGINFKTNGPLLFLLTDNWCYKIIIVPRPRTKTFSTSESLSYHIPICMILLNCFLVLPYLKYLRHALPPSDFKTNARER